MSKNYKKPKFHTVSGSSVGKRRTKIVGCDHCNHNEVYDANVNKKTPYVKSPCARCKNMTVRIFDSKAEFTYAAELKILESVGEISDIEYQVKYDLHAPDFETGKPVKVCTYIADFAYFEHTDEGDDYVIVDVKGGNADKVVVTPEAKLKIDWLEKEYGVTVQVVGR